MTLSEAMGFLDGFVNYERKPPSHYGSKTYSLRRMLELMEALKSPHARYKTLHIAGSKGKGSSAAMAASILQRTGRRVGLYTSPHLVRFGERIKVDGQDLRDEELCDLVEELQPVLERYRSHGVTYFEAVTAMAFLCFAKRHVDVAVLEVGLGGRLDATNVVRPQCALITTLDLEHTDRLGDTLEKIASEKAGVIKRNVSCVTTCMEESALRVAEERARWRKCDLIRLGKEFHVKARNQGYGQGRDKVTVWGTGWEYRDLEVGLLGWHQRINAAGVVAMMECVRERGEQIPENAIREGLRGVEWKGRMQWLPGHPPLLLDCAHSVASALALRRSIDVDVPSEGPRIGLVGFLEDKDYQGFIRMLGPVIHAWIVTEPDSPRSRRGQDVVEYIRSLGFQGHFYPLEESLNAARTWAGNTGLVVVTGSVYLVGEILCELEQDRRLKEKDLQK